MSRATRKQQQTGGTPWRKVTRSRWRELGYDTEHSGSMPVATAEGVDWVVVEVIDDDAPEAQEARPRELGWMVIWCAVGLVLWYGIISGVRLLS